jgi:hypothetical protein
LIVRLNLVGMVLVIHHLTNKKAMKNLNDLKTTILLKTFDLELKAILLADLQNIRIKKSA